ncbi:MDR family MFS transporter [Paenibacillus forsythiae]
MKWEVVPGIHPIGWNIILGTLFSRVSTSMSIPFLSIYLTQVKHVSPAITGIIVGTSSLMGIFTSFYGGYLSDLFGRQRVLLFSAFAWSVVFALFFVANSVFLFFISNALNGICQSIFEPSSKALLSDISEDKNRLQIFNLRYTAINIGVIFGPMLGLKLGSSHNTFPFLIAGLTYLLYGASLVFSFSKFKIEERKANPDPISIRTALNVTRKDTVFVVTLAGMILSISGYAHFSSTLPQYFAEKMKNGAQLFSFLLSLNAFVAITVQYPLVKIMKKIHPLNSLILGNIFISFSLFFVPFTSNSILLMMIVLFFTIGEVLIFSMIDFVIDDLAKPGLKGTYFGAFGFNRLGNVLGPWLGGFLLSTFHNDSLYIFSTISITTLLGIPALVFSKNKLKAERAVNGPFFTNHS